jgi:hypothetical protein
MITSQVLQLIEDIVGDQVNPPFYSLIYRIF